MSLNLKQCVPSLLLSTAMLTIAATPARAFNIVLGGSSYNVTAKDGTFTGLLDELERQPWWNSPALAQDAASQVKLQLTQSPAAQVAEPLLLSVLYATNTDTVTGDGVVGFGYFYNGGFAGALEGVDSSTVSDSTFTYAIATPVPAPALLPGLIGFGMSIVRKKRKQEVA